MLSLSLPATSPLRVACFGAHCDDIEIGCAGTLLALARNRTDVEVRWFVFSGDEVRAAEARAAALALMPTGLNIEISDFKDGYFPFDGKLIKDRFEDIKRQTDPHIIFTHSLEDRHQDHRLIADLTWNTFRDHLILEYEIPKYEGDLPQPNVFVPLTADIVDSKIDVLLNSYPSQSRRRWFSDATFRALMRLRGVESNSEYAEGFYCRKVVVDT